MKKLTLIVGALMLLSLLATSAFTHPLAVRNGVVFGYTAGKSLTVHTGSTSQDYVLTSNTTILPSSMSTDMGAGARVTVVAQCFAPVVGANVSNSNAVGSDAHFGRANTNPCYALAVIVRAAASLNTGASSGSASSATPSPSVTATPTP